MTRISLVFEQDVAGNTEALAALAFLPKLDPGVWKVGRITIDGPFPNELVPRDGLPLPTIVPPPAPPPAAPGPAPQPEEAVAAPAASPSPAVTAPVSAAAVPSEDDVRAAVSVKLKTHRAKIVELLKSYDAEAISGVPPAKRAEFIEKVKGLA